MKFGTDPIKKYDLSSLRVLGTVGEPINPEAWRWYFEEVGKKNCVVVDTFWQTETGGHMVTNLPGCTPMKPGAASFPMFGVKPAVVDPTSGTPLEGNGLEGVLCFSQPWPGIARSIWGAPRDASRTPGASPHARTAPRLSPRSSLQATTSATSPRT